ncbi:hypothetical protein [Paracoccus aerodenitrificans]|uniref:hypothetical protein n=1 Tax=Paracoccus aerodenitrificans TaxID=3017781 RepID=UPI0022F0D5FA|nr:hypothetical protein [Paracoccus aerodenitrificans]WBU63566.1 hypothetical protein PAE61_14590 [Paracoccus aerodenitrificans]
MLRMGFMPSDFHPVLLVLGQPKHLMVFADALEKFSDQGGSLSLNDEGAFSTDTKVMLEEHPAGGPEKVGLWPVTPGSMELVWRLPKNYAWIFSNEVANLANSGEPAGSATLECDILGEVRVKVSIGEWEDHYLSDEIR